MAANGSSPGTIKTAHSTLSAALAAWVRSNPFHRVNVALLVTPPAKAVRTNRGEPIHLPTEGEILAILDHLRETADDLEPLYRLTIATGLRQGEAIGLRWSDLKGLAFHLTGETPSMTIRRTIDPQTGKPGPTKSKAGTREVRISTALMTILGDHYRRLGAKGRKIGPDDYVFPGIGDAPLKADALRHHLYRVQAATGVESFRWHDFRHYLVTKRLARGDNATAVSRSVGHARVATTFDMYDQTSSVDLPPMDEPDVAPTPIVRVVEGGRAV
jgi:integrase